MDELCQDFVSSDLLRLKDLRILTRPLPRHSFIHIRFVPAGIYHVKVDSSRFSPFILMSDSSRSSGEARVRYIRSKQKNAPHPSRNNLSKFGQLCSPTMLRISRTSLNQRSKRQSTPIHIHAPFQIEYDRKLHWLHLSITFPSKNHNHLRKSSAHA